MDKEVTAAQLLSKQQFPYVDGLEDTSIVDPLVSPAFSEFFLKLSTQEITGFALALLDAPLIMLMCSTVLIYSGEASCN